MNIMRNGIRLLDGNDIVFDRVDWSLYAWGCRFGCEHCHTKHCNNENNKVIRTPKDIVEFISNNTFHKIKYTLCLMGGDFYFQCEELKELLDLVLRKLPNFYTVMFSGCEPTDGTFWGDKNFPESITRNLNAMVLGRAVEGENIVKYVMTKDKTERKLVKIV